MDAECLGNRLTEKFADRVEWTARSKKRLYLRVDPAVLEEVFGALRSELPQIRLCTSTGLDTRGGVEVFHHLSPYGLPLVVTLKIEGRKPLPSLPSLGRIHSAAIFIEREISDFLGVDFVGHPDPRRLLKARAFGDDVHPLRRDFDVREFKRGIGEEPEF
ncbi:MAG: NADH-quinone oxidoreductase subunit C [Planctomycetes bacterium]|jgi:Ni,Fe-hydrogenase III component G|nr:NADH-quinone oxidoreductase subunit C [Planctomycetota bacterium]